MIDTQHPTIYVLDHGHVALLDHLGSDLAIVQAAQASLDNCSETYGEREQAILRSLIREEHGTPLESVVLKFHMRLPIFLARQFVKHRTSSWSEQSGRYDELDMQFYVPDEDDVRTQVGRTMSYTYAPVEETVAREFRQGLRLANHQAAIAYQRALDAGVAKEVARLCLPVNLYTNVVWTMNVRALFNFLRLRVDAHAQLEAQRYGKAFEELAALVVPDAIEAFVASGRPKP